MHICYVMLQQLEENKIEYEDSLDNKAEVKGGMGDESYPFELR